jgi:hypothetical protein
MALGIVQAQPEAGPGMDPASQRHLGRSSSDGVQIDFKTLHGDGSRTAVAVSSKPGQFEHHSLLADERAEYADEPQSDNFCSDGAEQPMTPEQDGRMVFTLSGVSRVISPMIERFRGGVKSQTVPVGAYEGQEKPVLPGSWPE